MRPEALDSAPLLARGELWALISTGFLDPFHEERFALLVSSDFRQRCLRAASLVRTQPPAGPLGLGELGPEELSPERVFAAYDQERQDIERSYRKLFGLTAFSESCPECEIEYHPNTDVSYRSQQMADVAGFYRAFGMQLSRRAGERVDHVSIETEFLHLLSVKEAVARIEQEENGAEICRDARRKFFREHVGWWLPAFVTLLRRLAPGSFYPALASFAAALAAQERVSLELPPFEALPQPTPPQMEAAGTCFECVRGAGESPNR